MCRCANWLQLGRTGAEAEAKIFAGVETIDPIWNTNGIIEAAYIGFRNSQALHKERFCTVALFSYWLRKNYNVEERIRRIIDNKEIIVSRLNSARFLLETVACKVVGPEIPNLRHRSGGGDKNLH